jgi:hypothetical protein
MKALYVLLAGLTVAFAQSAVPGTGLPQGLFALREMDMHLHSGMERPVDMDAWLAMAVKDGRKVAALIDHLELYRKTPAEYETWRSERKFQARYPLAAAGHQAVMDDFDAAAARHPELLLFRAWEVYEGELDSGLEWSAMEKADVIGFHISPNNGRKPPNGQTLIKRARQAREMQKKLGVPVVLLHPFTSRVENVQRTAINEGREMKDISVAEYRFFQPGEQQELAEILRGGSIYIEIAFSSKHCQGIAACFEAMRADIRPLADMGVPFTVSTDHHGVASARQTFDPETFCGPLGVTEASANTIIRELLAIRARRQLRTK